MANQDYGDAMMTAGGSPDLLVFKQLKIITTLLRQGFNIQGDEDASFSKQTDPGTYSNPQT